MQLAYVYQSNPGPWEICMKQIYANRLFSVDTLKSSLYESEILSHEIYRHQIKQPTVLGVSADCKDF